MQQAAEREIEHVSRQLSAKEELLLQVITDIEAQEAAINGLNEKLAQLRADFEKVDQEGREITTNLAQREREHTEERAKITPTIDAASLSMYNRVKDKYPTDPLVPLKGLTCSGCFMQLGPQIVVQISRGEGLQRCRGCSRIVYIDEEAQKAAEVSKAS